MWPLRKRQRGGRASKHEGIAEVEAFPSGHYVRYLVDNKRPVPAWAWLNELAHGSHDDITALTVSEPRRALWNTNAWEGAVAFLAQELVSQAPRRGRTLSELQRSTLIPLELELAGRSRRWSYLTPAQFALTVLSALDRPTSRHM